MDAAEAVERVEVWAAADNRVAALKAHWPTSKRGWLHSNENNTEKGTKEPFPPRYGSGSQKVKTMKIAITTSGSDLDAPLDSRFGRAPKFLIYYSDLGTYHVQKNEKNLNATQGAGIQSALHLCDEKVDCVITGNCGPKAYATLSAANISVYTVESTTVGEAIEMLKRGELTEAQEANVEAHWA